MNVGTMTSKPLSAAERVAALMGNSAPAAKPAGTHVNSGSPPRKRKNCTNSVSQKRPPAPNSIPTAPTIVAVSPSATADSMGVSDNIMAGTNLISQALNFLMTANIKTSHEDRNLETTRSQVRALSAEVGELKESRDRVIRKVADLSSALDKEKTEKAELERKVSDHEAEKTASANIGYIVGVVDVIKRLKEEAPDVDLGFLRDDLKAYVACYPPPPGVVLDFGVFGTMDELLNS